MFRLGDFLTAAMSDAIIIVVDNGIKHKTTIDKINKEYIERTFTSWEMCCGRLTFYLDKGGV